MQAEGYFMCIKIIPKRYPVATWYGVEVEARGAETKYRLAPAYGCMVILGI